MTSRLGRIVQWLGDYYLPLLNALATAGCIIGSVLVASSSWWWFLLLPSCLLSSWVLLRSVKHENKLSVIQTKLLLLKSELAPDSVAVVLSAISEEWQTLLERELLNLLLTRNFLPVVYVPRQNYSIQEQRTHLRRIIEKNDRLLGIIMIVINPESRREELRQFCAEFGKPIIFVDNPPFEVSDSYPVNTTFLCWI
jgi:hypothetical protein